MHQQIYQMLEAIIPATSGKSQGSTRPGTAINADASWLTVPLEPPKIPQLKLLNLEGPPEVPYSKTLVPKYVPALGFGIAALKLEAHGPSGYAINA